MTTPRPWQVEFGDSTYGFSDEVWGINGPDDKQVVVTDMGHYPPRREDAELIVTAVNAFAALLAIAKGADEFDTRAELREKISALDAAHPDWRTWA